MTRPPNIRLYPAEASAWVARECVGCGKALIRKAEEQEPKCLPCSGAPVSIGRGLASDPDQEIYDEQQHESDHAAGGRYG